MPSTTNTFCEVVVVAQKTNGNDVDNSCDTQVGHVREVEGNEKDESNSNEKLDNEDSQASRNHM